MACHVGQKAGALGALTADSLPLDTTPPAAIVAHHVHPPTHTNLDERAAVTGQMHANPQAPPLDRRAMHAELMRLREEGKTVIPEDIWRAETGEWILFGDAPVWGTTWALDGRDADGYHEGARYWVYSAAAGR